MPRTTWLIAAAAVLESGFLVAFLALMDFHDREHWLLFCAVGLVYGPLAVGLVVLGIPQKDDSQRLLHALELTATATKP
jgi:hypothetical protein